MKWLLIFVISFNLSAKEKDPADLYKKVFKGFSSTKVYEVADTISDNPINNKILQALDKEKKTIGFIREVVTTTGCDSACLPVIATFFYTKDRKFLGVRSRDGLTKKYHASFTQDDYQNLEMILMQNPEIFKGVVHPKQMVDAITSQTTKEFSVYVIKDAAYSTLRLNLYNQDTLKLLQGIK